MGRAVTRWEGGLALVVDLPGRRVVAEQDLPEELGLIEPPAAALVIASFPANDLGPGFREVAVVFHVADGSGPALHCPWSVVDDFTAVVMGPELFGVPRHMGRIASEVDGDSLTAVLWRSGTEVLRVQAALGDEQPGGDHVYGGRRIAQSASMFAAAALVERRPFCETIHTTRVARAAVSIEAGADEPSPLSALVVSDGASGRLVTLDLDLSARETGATDDTDASDDNADGEVEPERVPHIVFTGIGGASVMMPLYTTLG